MPVIAHLSDLHLGGSDHALARVRAVVDTVRRLTVDAVLVTGDVAEHGTVEEYEQAVAELGAFEVPVLALPGNHDERTAFRDVLLADGGPIAGAFGGPIAGAVGGPHGSPDEAVNASHLVGGVLLALCDSGVPGRSWGRLDEVTLAWLDSVLTAHAGPALVCLHHPPVPTGLSIMDEILLTNPDDLAAVVTGQPQVTAVLTGHAHLGLTCTFAGRSLVVAPGVVSTLRLPWQLPSPRNWVDAVEPEAAPPGFVVHHVDGDGRLTSYPRAVPWAG
jgi:3',5'-cyclic-AMP phosphodiesterase